MTLRSTIQFCFVLSLVATLGYAVDATDSDRGDKAGQTTPVADRRAANAKELDGVDGRRKRLREGMKLVNQIGELRNAGGRVAFYPDGEKRSLQLLENLALERVGGDLDPPYRKWSVSGLVTEYKGGNYLLLHRAVLKARVSHTSAPPS
ncbi:MAG: hypothetical protein H8E66_12775 [Planctomycetes bacterium]|nr:hypothetical protein [Planctomycetota bacterium]